MTLLIGSLQQGFIYGILALGIYITFRILNIPDLTVDGSFTLGLAVSATLTVSGHPNAGILVAFLAGACAGSVTGLLQTKLGIHPILSGILTMSGLYTVNLRVLGESSNVSLIGTASIFEIVRNWGVGKEAAKTLVPVLYCVVGAVALIWFFRTHLGLCIRATGDNEDMVRASSINVDAMKITALAISNGFVALSGALIAQYQGYADISSGIGTVVVGLASVIIGEVFFGKRSVVVGFFSAITGAVLYRFMIALALVTKIFPQYAFKLVSAVIVIIALAIPTVSEKIRLTRTRWRAGRHA